MFDSLSENTSEILSHIDIGLDFSLTQYLYTIVLTVFYFLTLTSLLSYPTKTSLLYLVIGLIFLMKIVLFALISVQFYAQEVEHQQVNPFDKISNWKNVFITGGIVSGIIGIGFLFLVIPGIYFGYRFSYAIPITAIHKQSPKSSLQQSWKKTKGKYLEILLINGLTTLIFGFISVGILASYLLTVEHPILGSILGILFIAHASLFEVGVFCAVTSLELDSYSN